MKRSNPTISLVSGENKASFSMEVDGNCMHVIRELPARKRWVNGVLRFELTRASVEFIEEHFPEAIWDPSTDDFMKKLNTLRNYEHCPPVASKTTSGDYVFKTEPYGHQLEAFNLSKDLEFFGFFMEMGTGKTKLCIDTIAYLRLKGEIDNVLILAPNNVHRQWIVEQLPVHLPDSVKHLAAYHRSGASGEERRALTALHSCRDPEILRIFSMNIESLSSATGETIAKVFCQSGRTLCILDESSRIKNHKARRTDTAMEIRDLCSYRRIATGTSITKGIEDLYTQLGFMHRDILGFSSFYTFKARYCVEKQETLKDGRRFSKIVNYKNVEELKRKIAAWTYQVKKEDCLDLPKKIYMERIVELHPEQEKMYNSMKDELIMKAASGELISAPYAITQMLRLQQIICGHIPLEDGSYEKVPSTGKNPRLEAVQEIVDETDEQIIIWSRFTADVDMLVEHFKHKAVRYDGKVSEKQRAIAIDEFKSGEKQIFVGNPMAAGIGLNLTEATIMIYYSNDFNAETRWQSEDRFHRIGQTKNVTIIDLVAPGTLDRKILSSLKNKKSIAEMISKRGGLKDFLAE